MRIVKDTPIWVKRTANADQTYQGRIIAYEPHTGFMAVSFQKSVGFTNASRENVIWGFQA
jgi:hypothetical protein